MEISLNGLKILISACDYAVQHLEAENKFLSNVCKNQEKIIEDNKKIAAGIILMKDTLTKVLTTQIAKQDAIDN